MINAETQLMYASDYPHWDFDLPSTIYDLPFLSEKAKHNILGGTAARLFGLNRRSKTQADQLRKFGNILLSKRLPPPIQCRPGAPCAEQEEAAKRGT